MRTAELPPVVRFAQTAIAPDERAKKEIEAELVAVRSARDSLLGVEQLSATVLEERAHKLHSDLKFSETGYQRLSLEPLNWTKRWSNWPMFAVYPLHNPHMIIRSESAVRHNNGSWIADHWPILYDNPPTTLPAPVLSIYKRHQENMNGSKRITSTFQGVIPKTVREDIKTAEPLFKTRGTDHNSTRTDIFLIGEASWVEGSEPSPPPMRRFDPLVVGWDGARDYLWLISHFDLTSIERYMVDEFPALPAHTDLMRLPGVK